MAETGNQISFARQYHDDAVASLNKLVRTIRRNFLGHFRDEVTLKRSILNVWRVPFVDTIS